MKRRYASKRLRTEPLSQVGSGFPDGQGSLSVEDYGKMVNGSADFEAACQKAIDGMFADPPEGFERERYQKTAAIRLLYNRSKSSRAARLHVQEEEKARVLRVKEERSKKLSIYNKN